MKCGGKTKWDRQGQSPCQCPAHTDHHAPQPRARLLIWTVYTTTPPSVACELMELWPDLLVPVVALVEWPRKNQDRVDVARA